MIRAELLFLVQIVPGTDMSETPTQCELHRAVW